MFSDLISEVIILHMIDLFSSAVLGTIFQSLAALSYVYKIPVILVQEYLQTYSVLVFLTV